MISVFSAGYGIDELRSQKCVAKWLANSIYILKGSLASSENNARINVDTHEHTQYVTFSSTTVGLYTQ